MNGTLVQRRGGAYVCTCSVCGREEASADAGSLEARLGRKGWSEGGDGVLCPDCAGFANAGRPSPAGGKNQGRKAG